MIFGSSRVTESKLKKIRQQDALLLVANHKRKSIGFKLGYVVQDKPVFFSWLGGVHPEYRRQGIAQALLDRQEQHAAAAGMDSIYFTTFDRFPAMIELGKNNNYILVRSEKEGNEVKYWYEKALH